MCALAEMGSIAAVTTHAQSGNGQSLTSHIFRDVIRYFHMRP